MIPLYIDPGQGNAWTEVATAASHVDITAIINPNSGPDPSGPDSAYTSGMSNFASAGVTMLGYVHTSFGSRSISDVTNDIDTYASKYTGLSGIFIDEASSSANEIDYYTQVYNAITSHAGFTQVVLNPGTQPDQGYFDISTNLMVFEDLGSNFKSNQFASWVTNPPDGNKYHFSAVGISVSSGNAESLLQSFASSGMGYVFVTDQGENGGTYNTLVSYWTQQVTDVAALT
jgi:hypothetical protein